MNYLAAQAAPHSLLPCLLLLIRLSPLSPRVLGFLFPKRRSLVESATSGGRPRQRPRPPATLLSSLPSSTYPLPDKKILAGLRG